MNNLFIDTSGWGNLFDSSQPYHFQATDVYLSAKAEDKRIITTNYIIIELVSLLIHPLRVPRQKLIQLISGLKTSPYLEIIHVDASLDQQVWQFFQSHQDKEWSLVDCASFVVMKERDINEALTNDHHFEQAGFIRLLR
jgi:predicted nucleic acid-binding protein